MEYTMKSDKRKELEMHALLRGVNVTYGRTAPSRPRVGDRFYSTHDSKYYISGDRPDETLRLLFGLTEWHSVGSKRFFDLSDIE